MMFDDQTWLPSTMPTLAETRAIFDREREERRAPVSTRTVLMHPDDAAKLFERQDGDANRGTLSIDLGTGSGPRRRR